MFTKSDKEHCENLIRALKKGNFSLEGMEVLALADVFKWVSALSKRIDVDLASQAAVASAQPVDTPISE